VLRLPLHIERGQTPTSLGLKNPLDTALAQRASAACVIGLRLYNKSRASLLGARQNEKRCQRPKQHHDASGNEPPASPVLVIAVPVSPPLSPAVLHFDAQSNAIFQTLIVQTSLLGME
jgi:hypothetical protein